jgi:predicted ribosome quality control (RQC) complex YloA/Tae2 family protein
VLTDWLIVRRLGAELDRALRGSRIRAAGRIADGRLGLRVPAGTVAIDAFGPTPIVTLEGAPELERAAGWVRTMADALEGLRIDRVRSRRGDRLLAFECSSRSRFGVESGYRLVIELVPRFGNVVLLKDDTVVSAAKEFGRDANAVRATVVGEGYEPPPLPAPPAGGLSLVDALRDFDAAGGAPPEAAARAVAALRVALPLLPRLIAESLVAETARAAGAAPAALAERCLARGAALLEAADGEPDASGDVFAYRDGARLVQCHVLPLAQFSALTLTREPALVPLLGELVGGATLTRARQGFTTRRAALAARVEKRRLALAAERAALERERDDAARRDSLRRAGELLYAHLADVPAGATSFVPPSEPGITIALDPALDAKGNAAAIFRRYRKAVAKLEHTSRRLAELASEESVAEELAWELERAEPETLEDVAESVERFERRKSVVRTRAGKRRPLDVKLGDGARVYVGRSPHGNADLTFRVARPDDLWFHARATPGAHVVLHVDSQRAPHADELVRAAELAAYHSKARESEKVAVDYTERKHVRRQRNAPPGLVWYTNARTLTVRPRSEPAL